MPDNIVGTSDPRPPRHTPLWTIEQAAAHLGVSPRYLRDTSCPRVRLPGLGPRRQAVVRFIPSAVRGWVDRWRTDRPDGAGEVS